MPKLGAHLETPASPRQSTDESSMHLLAVDHLTCLVTAISVLLEQLGFHRRDTPYKGSVHGNRIKVEHQRPSAREHLPYLLAAGRTPTMSSFAMSMSFVNGFMIYPLAPASNADATRSLSFSLSP